MRKQYFLIYLLFFQVTFMAYSQETYVMQTGNFNSTHTTNTDSNYFAGTYNNGGSELGVFAN